MSPTQPHRKTVAKPQRLKVRMVGSTSDERDAGGEQPEYRGLCATCKHTSTCTFPRSKDRPVHFCEEFDGEEDKPALTAVHHEKVLDQEALADREKYPGICSTCEKRETCTFPKPEGGVWQCEEFV